jgi:hypothetical protein
MTSAKAIFKRLTTPLVWLLFLMSVVGSASAQYPSQALASAFGQ